MALTIIILDGNLAYSRRLGDAFMERHGDMAEVFCVSSVEEAAEIIGEEHPMPPLVLADLDHDLADRRLDGAARMYLVRMESVRQVEGFPAVCRYAAPEEIFRRLLYAWMEHAAGWCRGVPERLSRVLMGELTGEKREAEPAADPGRQPPLGPLEVMMETREDLSRLLDRLAPQVRLVVVVTEKEEGSSWSSFGVSGDAGHA